MPVAYKDYYKILGVKKDASADEIRRAYRTLARKYHPDLNKGAESEKRFKEANEAHEVLSDPEKRRRYDTLGPDWERYAHGGGGAGNGGAGFRWTYGGRPGAGGQGFEDVEGFSDFFRQIFGDLGGEAPTRGNGRTRARSRAGVDAEHELEVTLDEAFRGSERQLQIQREDGASRMLSVKVPAGVRDGQRIRLAGQGGPGLGGGPSGDLYLKVRVKPHPFFTRDGDDLRADLPVALHEALLGGEASVPTLKGRVALRIPPETQNGRTIRLAGQGMPRQTGGSGDLYVTVKVVLPTKLTDTERECVREIAASRGDDDVRKHLL